MTDKADDCSKMHEILVDSDATFLMKTSSSIKKKRLIAIVEVKARDDSRVSLGTYNKDHPPGGFILEVSPSNVQDGEVASQVICLGLEKSNSYELSLMVSNYGAKTVTAEVWEV